MVSELVAGRLRPVSAFQHRLQPCEIGVALRIGRDDLAVDQAAGQIERHQCLDQRLEFVGPVLAIAGPHGHVVALGGDQRAIPVELDLVHPAVSGGHRIDQCGELGCAKLRLRRGLGLAPGRRRLGRVVLGGAGHLGGESLARLARERVAPARIRRDLGHRASGQHAGQFAFDQRIAFAGEFILELAQQPVLALLVPARLEPDQQPFALHPGPNEGEMQVALVDILPALAWHRGPGAAVPQHHRPPAVFALGDRAFELGISERMVLGPYREALDRRIGRRTFGHRPAFEHAVRLDPEVPVQPRRIVLLDDEAVAA